MLGDMMRKLKDSSPELDTMLATGQFSVWCKLLTTEHCQYLDWLVIESRPCVSLFHMQYPHNRVKSGFKFCEAQGKGRARGGPGKVTLH